MNHRSPRIFGAIALALSMTLALMIGTAVAATPKVTIGSGIDGTNTTDSAVTPAVVSTNKLGGFYIWARNDDTSTISQFFLNSNSDMTAKGAVWYRSTDPDTKFTCPISHGQLACSFGQLRPTETIFVTAAFTSPSTATADNNSCLPASPTDHQKGVGPGTNST